MADPLPKTAEDARQRGLKRFQGGLCNRCGHVTVRRIRGGKRGSECLRCVKLRERRRKARCAANQ